MQASDSSSLPHKLQASTSSTIGPSLVSASNATANTPPFSSALSALSTLAETSISSAAPVLEQDADGRHGHGVSDDSNGERVSKASKRRKKELSMRKACERCRERKNACDGNCPCSMCVKSFQDMQAAGSPCLFSSAAEMCVRNTRKSIFQARTDRKETDVSDLPPHSASSPTHEGTWFAAWRSSPQGPFPVGNNHLQPSLSLALPDNTARNQSFRMNLHLSLPSSPPSHLRFLFSNLYGRSPLRLTHLSLARHAASAHVHPATQLDLTFGGHNAVVLAAGCEHASDAIALPPWLSACGGRVSVTFAVNGTCEGVTWHAKAMATNYMSSSGSGTPPQAAGDVFFQHSCTSWFFLCGVDACSTAASNVLAVLGDSITDGTNSTINGCDRWPDILGRFINEKSLNKFTYVINCGIGGNSICGPLPYPCDPPHRGGSSAALRMSKEVLVLQGLTCCIWSQGINDFSANTGASASSVISAVAATIAHARTVAPHVKFIGCTVASAFGSTCEGHGGAEQDTERKAFNGWLRSGTAPFDKIIDFDALLTCPTTGRLRPEFDYNTSVGGAGDGLHPNRVAFVQMAAAAAAALHEKKK